ncbi:MAG: hypothetical protein OEN50_02830 [Deltaproteobacteria bacterium]|nr:hypothetical protein [Deltaproteobacteria bacterium]
MVFAPRGASANHVVMQGGPFLGVVVAIVVDPVNPQNLFLASYGGGVFRSRDGGRSWKTASTGLPDRQVFTLAIDPSASHNIYAGTDRGVFRSTDNGASWSELTPALRERNIRALGFDPGMPNKIYVATDQGVFQGQQKKWTHLTAGLSNRDVRALAVAADGTLFAGTFGGIFRKLKDHTSWIAANDGLEDKKARSLALDPTKPQLLYAGTAVGGAFKSANSGRSWTSANKGLLNSTVLALAVTPDFHGTIYAATIDGVFKSTDGARSWRATDSSLAMTVPTITFSPRDPEVLYAGSGGHLFMSENGGNKWREISHHHVHYFGPTAPPRIGGAAEPNLAGKEVKR